MSSQAGLRSCTLTNADDQAVSGAASTCVRAYSRVDIFSPVPRRSSSATGKCDAKEDDCRGLGGSTLRVSARTRGYTRH